MISGAVARTIETLPGRQPWPAVDSRFAAVATALAGELERRRALDNEPKSVRMEQEMERRVEALILELKGLEGTRHASPLIPTQLMQAMARDPAVARQLIHWTRLRASLLYPLSFLVYDPEVEEITCYAHDHWLVTRTGNRVIHINPPEWRSDHDLLSFFRQDVLGIDGVKGQRQLTDAAPTAEASFGELRFTVVAENVLCGYSSVSASIRVPNQARFRTLRDFLNAGSISRGAAEFLVFAVRAKANVLVSGGTRSGKTTLLRVLCGYIEPSDRVVTVEDTVELNLSRSPNEGGGDGRVTLPYCTALNTVPSSDGDEPRFGLKYLVKRCMRLAPDRIILGEMRGAEAADVVRAMTSGHDGCMTTIHADDAKSAIRTMTLFCCENESFRSAELAEQRVRQAINLVVHIEKLSDERKRVTEILAVSGEGGNDVPVYRLNRHGVLQRECQNVHNLEARLKQRLLELNVDDLPL